MRRLIGLNNLPVVGLDIRMTDIRVIYLQRVRQKVVVHGAEMVELPLGAIVNGKIHAPERVVESISALLQRLPLKNHAAVIALPVQSVISKRVQLPKTATCEQRMQAVTEHLPRYFPGITQALCYDYVVLPTSNALQDEALLVAARQEQLTDYVNVAARAGLLVKVVDVDIYALARAARFAASAPMSLIHAAILEVGAKTAQFVVLGKYEVIYHLQFDYDKITDIYEKLSSAIQLCCSTPPMTQLNKIYLCGDANTLNDLTQEIEARLSIRAQIIHPFHQMLFSSSLSLEKMQAIAANMMVCCGLALREIPR